MGNSLFKNAVAPTTGNSWVTLYTAPAGQASLLLQLNGSVTGSGGVVGSARIFDASQGVFGNLVIEAAIPTGDTIRLIDKAKIVLEAGDYIQVTCNSPGQTIDFVASLIEDVNDTDAVSLGTYKNAVVPGVGNSFVTVYQAPAGKASFALQINACNLANTGVQVSVRMFDFSASLYVSLLSNATVPIADAIRLIDDSKIVLEANDRIEATCGTVGQQVDLVGSIIEDVNQL